MKSFFGLSLATAMVAVACAPARADVITVSDILTQFNAVVSDSFRTTSDVEGRLVAGSIDKGATFYNSPNAKSAPSPFQAVNAVTITSCKSCDVDNGGSVNYVASDSGKFSFNGGAGRPKGSLLQNAPSFAMSDFTAPLDAFESQLASMVANSYADSSNPNNFRFVLTPDASGIAVFDVAAGQLAGIRNMVSFTGGAAKTIVINVTGSVGYSFTQKFNFNPNAYVDEHVIWNFEDAGALNFKQWGGTILAGDATVANSSPLNGFLYAANFKGNGELHDHPFLGSVPSAPEASTWAMMALGFLGLGFAGWRRPRTLRTLA